MSKSYTRFTNMLLSVVNEEEQKKDYTVTCADMEVLDDGNTFAVDGVAYNLERHAFVQMVNVIHPYSGTRNNSNSVAEYLWDNKENGIFQYAMRQHIFEHPREKFLMRTYGENIRGFLSPNYAVMNNSTVMMRVASIMADNKLVTDDFRVVESTVDRDELRVKLLFNDFEQGQYGTGIYFTNNELGGGSVAFHSLVKRAICDNSLISADNMALYHRGNIINRMQSIEPELIASINHSATLLKLLNDTRKKPLTPEDHKLILDAIQERYSFTEDFVERMVVGSEGEQNLFGIVNGITYAAKECKNREHYEQIASKIIDKYLR